MADPKYAGLPGIVYDQPDVYETSDLPESEQEYHDTECDDSNPSLEVLHISGPEAFEKFKGKYVNAANIDFSDHISRNHCSGYVSNRPIEWNVGGEEEETIVEKYQRLQCEINQLQQQVEQVKDDTVKHANGEVSVVDLCKNVDELQTALTGLNLEESLGKEILSSIAEPEVMLQKKLVYLLENFKKTGLVSEKKDNSSQSPINSGNSDMTYELFYAPEHAKFNQMSRASQLETKLNMLEALIGNNPDKMSSLSTWTNHRSLLGAVEVLSSRMTLLEPSHLDHVEGRLHAVHTRMNSIAEKKAPVEDADKQSKVNELYAMMKKCEVLCSALPEVVDRISSVENLHQEATQFGRSLKQLDSSQTQLNSSLQSNAALLEAVQEKFLQNLNTNQKNLKSLNERLQNLLQSKLPEN